ncbi:hypothetical protein ABEB36_006558 [Hypothenemus hampei]|uniref:Sanpodo n=1 Tax=Hypothenemus hampei TaxID=57062 RepID=A0ABD1EQX7_HYPHA
MENEPHFYSNPAFCQQSEFYHGQQKRVALSPRKSPVGAQNRAVYESQEGECLDNVEEQEFYEEVIVDDKGFIKGKKVVVVAQNNEGQKYIRVPQKERSESFRRTQQRYQSPPRTQATRYEYIPMQEQHEVPPLVKEPLRQTVHRYAVIEPDEEETELQSTKPRYALVPINQVVPPQKHRYEYIQQSSPVKSPQNGPRYEYIPQQHSTPTKQYQSPCRPGTNPVATQKLHEILSTPKRVRKDPFRTEIRSLNQDKLRAVVPPMCSSPVQSIYGETTLKSWTNSSVNGKSTNGSALAVAAFIMFLCGLANTGLSFYMLSFMGRPYYLDFSTIAGFTCAAMGILGCRSRHVYWLPNRNYLSGYLVLTLFSLLTCTGLLLLLINDPRPGTPLADMTSAAVCGFSVLTLLLAITGVISSYCCKYPPPDNRVQHCSPGLTV